MYCMPTMCQALGFRDEKKATDLRITIWLTSRRKRWWAFLPHPRMTTPTPYHMQETKVTATCSYSVLSGQAHQDPIPQTRPGASRNPMADYHLVTGLISFLPDSSSARSPQACSLQNLECPEYEVQDRRGPVHLIHQRGQHSTQSLGRVTFQSMC